MNVFNFTRLREHLLCGKSALISMQRKNLFYTFLYNIKVHYPFVKRDNSNEIYFKTSLKE